MAKIVDYMALASEMYRCTTELKAAQKQWKERLADETRIGVMLKKEEEQRKFWETEAHAQQVCLSKFEATLKEVTKERDDLDRKSKEQEAALVESDRQNHQNTQALLVARSELLAIKTVRGLLEPALIG